MSDSIVYLVDEKRMSVEEFQKYQETLEKDKSKRLKEVSPYKYKTLSRMNG